eukprot:CAMPEP_0197528344 /NCGR_PEP_ID=MMETSP1318-20131121/24781_1 /TAXON_ID=552666 /ORGANISM="Partenskyella glossopodia, Strain RCC365" /LENGTH=234 /DNA_ID=CAMNT_0043083403 /DNA_START=34 /DNA_END=738 /DNA_ORIENTATION=-
MGQGIRLARLLCISAAVYVAASAVDAAVEHGFAYDTQEEFENFYREMTRPDIRAQESKLFEECNMSSPTYGEMSFKGTHQMLDGEDTNGKVFIDLGSGLGSPVIAAALQFPDLKECVGIELSPARHDIAEKAKAELVKEESLKAKIKFVQGNMLLYPVQEADIIYISSLCFPDSFMQILGKYLDENLETGTIVMSSREVKLSRSEKVGRVTVEMSWNDSHKLHKYIIGPKDSEL